jgi:excisionase family DNA binding protein
LSSLPSLTLLADALGVPANDLSALLAAAQAADTTAVALTVEEAARRLGIGRTTMYALIASGQVQSVRIGRLRRIPAEALAAYLAIRTQAPAPTAAHAA